MSPWYTHSPLLKIFSTTRSPEAVTPPEPAVTEAPTTSPFTKDVTDVPPELLDIIFENVAPRRKLSTAIDYRQAELALIPFAKDDIAAASLVSRKWRAAALPHLFHDITIHRRSDVPLPSHYVEEDKGGLRALVDFLDLHPAACRWIMHLSITAARCPARQSRPAFYEQQNNLNILSTVFNRLTNLRTLVLLNSTIGSGLKLPALQEVHIALPYASSDRVFATLGAFSTVTNLHLTIRYMTTYPPDILAPNLSVNTLFLHEALVMEHSSEILPRLPFFASLKGLVVEKFIMAPTSANMRRLLSGCSTSLNYLEVHMVIFSNPGDVDFFQMPWPELRTLAFSIADCERGWLVVRKWASVFASCLVLRTIKMGLPIPLAGSQTMDSCADNIRAVGEILGRLPTLDSVVVNETFDSISPPLPLDPGKRQLLMVLWPSLHQNGQLSFDW